MDLNEIITQLEYFGLEKNDSKIYTGLLRLGPTSVGILAAKLEIDRGKAYRSLSKLKDFGIVTTTFSNPTICTAVEPNHALTSIIDKKENEIITMKNLAKEIECTVNNVSKKSEITPSYLSIIQGRTNIFSRIGRLIHQAKKIVYIVTTVEDLAMMYHTSIPEKIEMSKKNGLEVRVITFVENDKDFAMIRRLNASETRVCRLPSKSRIIVEQQKELIMSGGLSDMMNMKDENDSVLCTNSIEMVNNMFSLCTLIWNKSKKIELLVTKKIS